MERGKELGQKLRKKIERSWSSIDKKQRLTPTDPHDFRQWKSAWSFSQINKLILIDRHLKPIDKAFIAFLSALDMKAHGKKITVYATNTQRRTALGSKHLST